MATKDNKGKSASPWRFMLFFAVLAAGWAAAVRCSAGARALLAGFDIAALVFLASHVPVFREDATTLRRAAPGTTRTG